MRLLLPAGVGARLRLVKPRRFEARTRESLQFPDFLPSRVPSPYPLLPLLVPPSRLSVPYGGTEVCEETGGEGRRFCDAPVRMENSYVYTVNRFSLV